VSAEAGKATLGPRAAAVLAFAAPGGEILVASDVDLLPYLDRFLGGWPVQQADAGRPADVCVAATPDGLRLTTRAIPDAVLQATGAADAANLLADMLSRLAAMALPGFAEVHAGAAAIGNGAVLLCGPSLCGKSTLALQLALRGHRLLADDRALVGPMFAAGGPRLAPPKPWLVALGLTPRARHPAHAAAGAAFAAFVARRALPVPGPVRYLALDADLLAPFGSGTTLRAIILPQQRESGGVDLRPLPAKEAVRVLAEQIHAPTLPLTDLVRAAGQLAAAVPTLGLVYDSSAAAAEAIERALLGGPGAPRGAGA